ncbi:MAG: hypothetical protein P8H36_06450 [Yoonia sp.]|nr:hypothetical protein [Yoonia sp.]
MMVPLASPVAADVLNCQMADETEIKFEIHRNQFVDPIDAAEPTQRKVTIVTAGAATFPAEPFIIGGMRGFYADGLGGSPVMFAVAPDGSATFSNARSGEKLTGICKDQ